MSCYSLGVCIGFAIVLFFFIIKFYPKKSNSNPYESRFYQPINDEDQKSRDERLIKESGFTQVFWDAVVDDVVQITDENGCTITIDIRHLKTVRHDYWTNEYKRAFK